MPPKSKKTKQKIYLLGEKGSGTQAKGPMQDFYKLRKKHLKEGTLFEDKNFPANDTSMYFTNKSSDIAWRRPGEIHKTPKFFVEGHSRFDAIQGDCKDCWVVAGISNLTFRGDLMTEVVPDDQEFDENYAGIFHFRFWQYGKWIDVVVDDRLPYNKTKSKLYYLRSRQKNEFWSPLLEKAYAKLNGCYESLYDGFTLDAMQDFTGGLTEVYRTTSTPKNFFEILRNAYKRSALVTCTLRKKESKHLEGDHAYSITKVEYIQRKNSNEKIPLIRLRNPWGVYEWNGAWSDTSKEWKEIAEDEKKDIGLVKDTDGEFWMSYEDFEAYYIRVEICNLCPHSASDDHVDSKEKDWKVSSFESKWVKDVTAGGRLICKDTFHNNPQYVITLTETDYNEDECTLIIGLLQKFRRQQKHLGVENLLIECEIFKLGDTTTKPLNSEFFQNNEPAAKSSGLIELREFTNRVKLPPGRYCIVPCTRDRNQEGEFLLRIFSEQLHVLAEHDDQVNYNAADVDRRVHCARASLEDKREDDQACELFQKYAGEVGVLNWNKLKTILDSVLQVETKERGFLKDTCRSMVAMLDRDQSGDLDADEFDTLWADIQTWKNVFRLYDEDNSGTLSSFELRQALNSSGYRVNFNTLNLLKSRYGNQKGELEFEDFILCAVKLKTMINIFKEQDPENTNNVTFTFDQWVANTLYA